MSRLPNAEKAHVEDRTGIEAVDDDGHPILPPIEANTGAAMWDDKGIDDAIRQAMRIG